MAEKEIYFVGFPSGYMMSVLEPIAFEVLEIGEKVLRIKLLEDHPPLEGIENTLLPRKDKEYTISRIHLLGGEYDILDELRSGNVVPWYRNREEGEEGSFGGVLFPHKRRT